MGGYNDDATDAGGSGTDNGDCDKDEEEYSEDGWG